MATVDELPELVVEVGFNRPTSEQNFLILDDLVDGKLDENALGNSTWTNITEWVHSCSVRHGANRVTDPILRYDAATISITLDNTDRRFDPTNLSGPYVSAGITQIVPMRPVRVQAKYLGGSYDMFHGYVDSWRFEYNATYSKVTLTATDATKVIANVVRTPVAPVGAGELSGARVHRILDSIGWPANMRDIDPGTSTMQATTLEGNAWDELQAVADSELGALFIAQNGWVQFNSRHWQMDHVQATNSQATFTDDNPDPFDDEALPYSNVTIDYDDATIYNDIRMTREGGAQQHVDDLASKADYLTRTYEKSGLLLESDSEVQSFAEFLLYQTKDPELRFDTLRLDMHKSPDYYLLTEGMGIRITIVLHPPGGGVITRDVFIRGSAHDIRPGSWTVAWTLQSASKWSFLKLSHAVLGRLDENALAY